MSVAAALAEVVRDAGYIPNIDNTVVYFKSEGTTYRIETFESDDGYARLMVGFLMSPGVPVARLLEAANEQNRKTKSVKTVVYELPEDGHVTFSVEVFFGEPAAWGPIFERALGALRGTSDEYYESVRATSAAT
jgi:hypothetical protein